MKRNALFLLIFLLPVFLTAQERSLKRLVTDSLMTHASVSINIIDGNDGRTIMDYNPERSLVPASVMKLVTTASALELLGPLHTFNTALCYAGTIDKKNGILTGNIVIRGGGDPVLGSENFREYYEDFLHGWISGIRALGIKEITGSVVSDDSYYDFEPVPPKWLWEDVGNYYGSGAYGLSVYDNTYDIHFNTTVEKERPVITAITPAEARVELADRLSVSGLSDSGYVYSSPYGDSGWISGSIPPDEPDFILKASVNDPPMLLAKILSSGLAEEGIKIAGKPMTYRSLGGKIPEEPVVISLTTSPPLGPIIEVLNHESVNLYAEHLVKELGKVFENNGSTRAGVKVINRFLTDSVGLKPGGIIMNDGSGLSPSDALDSKDLTALLFYMKKKGRHFREFYASLPEAGKDGTLKSRFRDPVFFSALRAKSGSMTRVRSYAGYVTARSGRELIFSFIINNFEGPSQMVITTIEDILREAAIKY